MVHNHQKMEISKFSMPLPTGTDAPLFASPAGPGTMIRIPGTYAYGPRIRNNLPCRKARLAFGDIHTTAKGATSEFMGKSHRRLKSFANDFGFKQIGAVHRTGTGRR